MMLSFVPNLKLVVEHKTELIFLVDRSGSMAGPGIEQARRALKVLFIFMIIILNVIKTKNKIKRK